VSSLPPDRLADVRALLSKRLPDAEAAEAGLIAQFATQTGQKCACSLSDTAWRIVVALFQGHEVKEIAQWRGVQPTSVCRQLSRAAADNNAKSVPEFLLLFAFSFLGQNYCWAVGKATHRLLVELAHEVSPASRRVIVALGSPHFVGATQHRLAGHLKVSTRTVCRGTRAVEAALGIHDPLNPMLWVLCSLAARYEHVVCPPSAAVAPTVRADRKVAKTDEE